MNYCAMQKPQIRVLNDFQDSTDFCFYLLGFAEGVRGEFLYEFAQSWEDAYGQGVKDGELFARWILFAATQNTN